MQIFLTFFKTLEGKEITVELKNDLMLKGILLSTDQYLNMKLGSVEVVDKAKFPQLVRTPATHISRHLKPPSAPLLLTSTTASLPRLLPLAAVREDRVCAWQRHPLRARAARCRRYRATTRRCKERSYGHRRHSYRRQEIKRI